MREDSELVQLALGGDNAAFAELYERYFDSVYDFLARMVHTREEAADLAQDTFLRAMNSLSSLSKGGSFKSLAVHHRAQHGAKPDRAHLPSAAAGTADGRWRRGGPAGH